MQLVIDTERKRGKDDLLQLFQTLVGLELVRGGAGGSSIREITDRASARFKKRLDTAQTHVALHRLVERGFAKEVKPKVGPAQRFVATESGLVILQETVSTMCSVLGIAEIEVGNQGVKNAPSKSGRVLRPIPADPLRQRR
ncbi:MAG: hypothetical protein ABL908_13900 [Hyphomicrobium sp.]